MIRTNIEDIYNTNEKPNKIDFTYGRNIIYFNRRKDIKNLINSINAYIHNSSQSLFLALYYMDSIFTDINLEKIFFKHFNKLDYLIPLNDIQMNNYALLAIACLILSYKFNENNPNLPSMSSFVKLLHHFSRKNFIFRMHDLAAAEVVVCKLLKYKLNYYTIYDFFVFFFTHGIIFRKTLQDSLLFGKLSEKKILEKIYFQAREIMDWIIESEEYFNYYFGKDNHIIVVEILLWTIEHILQIKIQDYENIFKLIYNIKISEEKHLKIYNIIEKLFFLKKSKLENNNKSFSINNNYSEKIMTYNIPLSFPTISSTRKSNSAYISIENTNAVSSNNKIFKALSSYEDSFLFHNNVIQNELDKFSPEYPYQFTAPNNSKPIERVQNNLHPKVICKKNPSIHSSNKNTTSSYNISSIIPMNSKAFQIVQNTLEIVKLENNAEKEPQDNHKKLNVNVNYIKEIDQKEIQGRQIILKNISSKIKKKSSSCSRKPYNTINNNLYNQEIKSSFREKTNEINKKRNNINANNNIHDMNMNDDELKFEEKINKPKVFYNKIKLSLNKNKNKKKETLFKKYQRAINENNSKQVNKKSVNNVPKNTFISNEELINRVKILCEVTKINQTVENEPRDNNKRSINKLKKKSEINNNNIYKNNNINDINKHNTIIINNNIHINTFMGNNNSIEKKNLKMHAYNRLKRNSNINELLILSNLSNIYKNNVYRQNFFSESKNGQNIINESYNLTDRLNNINNCNYYNNF